MNESDLEQLCLSWFRDSGWDVLYGRYGSVCFTPGSANILSTSIITITTRTASQREGIFMLQSARWIENKNLKCICNALLPKLISGEIEVPFSGNTDNSKRRAES